MLLEVENSDVMDAGRLRAAQEEELTDENYRMFLSDGSPPGQVWVLACGDPEAEGKTCVMDSGSGFW